MTRIDKILDELKLLHPQLIDLSLGRIERLLAKLGDPQDRLPPLVHIAGTNGKGSVSAFLRAILMAAGKRVHTYTSPHLVRFNERIVLADQDGRSGPIGDDRLCDVLERVVKVNAGEPITFFEVTTAAAFLAFSEAPADAVILEVGLGGRFDATNVVRHPRATIITPVSLDHVDKLGDTVALIAAEKAGILKPGVPAIISQQTDDGLRVITDVATRLRAPLQVWGQDFQAIAQNGRLIFQNEQRLADLPLPALLGAHQIVNAGTAVAAALELSADMGIDEKAIGRGLIEVRWPARMQQLTTGPLAAGLRPGAELWVDGGHNPAGGAAIADALLDLEERAPKPLHLVVGMLPGKDQTGFLSPFAGIARSISVVSIEGANDQDRVVVELLKTSKSLGFQVDYAGTLDAAIGALNRETAEPSRIMICGSLYLAGHVLALQEGIEQQPN